MTTNNVRKSTFTFLSGIREDGKYLVCRRHPEARTMFGASFFKLYSPEECHTALTEDRYEFRDIPQELGRQMNTTKTNDYETACINAADCARNAREAYAKAKAAKEAFNDANAAYVVAEAIAARAAATAKAIAYTEADSVSNESLYT